MPWFFLCNTIILELFSPKKQNKNRSVEVLITSPTITKFKVPSHYKFKILKINLENQEKTTPSDKVNIC